MKKNNNTLGEISAVLNAAEKCAVFCHVRPDGDAIGSGLAVCLALRNAGKTADMYCDDVIPVRFLYLPGADGIRTPEGIDYSAYDTLIAVDSADPARIGRAAEPFLSFRGVTVDIDHHLSDEKYAKYNYVYEITATCEMLPEIFDASGFEITGDIANLLMAGLVTDSGSFAHLDVTTHTLETAIRYMKAGANLSEACRRLVSGKSKQKALLYGRVINKLRFMEDDRACAVVILLSDLEACGADKTLTEGIVDFPLSIDDVEVAIAAMEMAGNKYRISLRSKGRVDVNRVAAAFGGGGHMMASGCVLSGDLDTVLDRLSREIAFQL